MTNILHIATSPRGPMSLTRGLGGDLLARLAAGYPDAQIVTRDLAASPLPHLDGAVVAAMFTPEDQRSASQWEAIALSDQLVDELVAADLVVIESPMFNWSVPSGLKAWIDHVVRYGRTFVPGETPGIYHGLLRDRPVYVVIASGGVYTSGPRTAEDFLTPYWRLAFGWMGVKDVRVVHAEGAAISEDAALAAGREQVALVDTDPGTRPLTPA